MQIALILPPHIHSPLFMTFTTIAILNIYIFKDFWNIEKWFHVLYAQTEKVIQTIYFKQTFTTEIKCKFSKW